MINISEEFRSALNEEVTYFTSLLDIKLKNNKLLKFTESDKDIVIADEIYYAQAGFVPSAIDASGNLDVDNFQIELAIDEKLVKQEDIANGLFDCAQINIFLVNYVKPSLGKLHLKSGIIAKIKQLNNTISRI